MAALQKITIGGDPEFLLANEQGQLHPANRVLGNSVTAQVGVDGIGTIGELRVPHADDAKKFCDNVKHSLELLADRLSRAGGSFQVRAGSTGGLSLDREHNFSGLGGHIHFGIPYMSSRDSDLADFYSLVRLFDAATLALAAIEDPSFAAMRRRSYGKLGSAEHKSWGFEYRAPASWILDKDTCFGVTALYHAIARSFDKDEIPASLHSLCRTAGREKAVHQRMLASGRLPSVAWLKAFKKAVLELPDIKKDWNGYGQAIKNVLAKAERKAKWDETSDVLKNWGIQCEARLVPKFLFAPQTFYAAEILRGLDQSQVSPACQVNVFGISELRDIDVVTSNQILRAFLSTKYVTINPVTQQMVSVYRTSSTGLVIMPVEDDSSPNTIGNTIGLGLKIRRDNQDLCREILALHAKTIEALTPVNTHQWCWVLNAMGVPAENIASFRHVKIASVKWYLKKMPEGWARNWASLFPSRGA